LQLSFGNHQAIGQASDISTRSMPTDIKEKKYSSPHCRVCGNCYAYEGSDGALKLSACSRCGLVMYCSRDCQRAHWKANHKQRCIPKGDRVPQHQKAEKDATSKSAALSGEDCAICLDPLLTDASATTLPCDHMFHGTCVAELRKFGVQQMCPLCRTLIPTSPEELYDEAARRFLVAERMVARGQASWSTLPASAQQELEKALAGWQAGADEGY